MPHWKLTIFKNVYETRLVAGEELKEIDASYPKLTVEEKEEIHKALDL